MNNYKIPAKTYIFINDNYVDDVYRIDWAMDESKIPIYGYLDKNYATVSSGRQRVVGNMYINFTNPGYLFDIIRRGIPQPQSFDYSNIESLKMRYLKALKTIYNESTTSSTDNPITRDATKRARISQLISEAIRNKAEPTIIQTLRDAFTRPPAGEPDQNKIEEPIEQNKRFNLQIYYGHPNKEGTIIRTIENCFITGTSEVISAAGSPGGDMSSSAQSILEVYPFIGQKITSKVLRE